MFRNKALFLLTVFLIMMFAGCRSVTSSTSAASSSSAQVSSSSQEVQSSAAASPSGTDKQQTSSQTKHSSSAQSNSSSQKPASQTKPAVSVTKPEAAKTVTLTIDAAKGNDGVVVSGKQVSITAGDTVFSILKRYCDSNKILLSAHKSGNGEYVSSIDGVAEFDNGSQSGWLYSVSGTFPSVDCNSYKLSGGETVKWVYTLDNGKTEEGK